MAIATEQLEAIKKDLTHAFADDPHISVVPTEGNPPDTYEITYRIEGLQKTPEGEVEKADHHVVSISIPFGFPHFPPSCKPKSPIFHPDFDPAAICIGDFWEKNRSIVDLISHIREMISGAVYSTANAFNEEAAQWYAEHVSEPQQPRDQAEAEPEGTPPSPADQSGDEIISLLDDDDADIIQDDLLADYDPADGNALEPALSFVDEPAEEDDAGEDALNEIFKESDFDFEASQTADDGKEPLAPPDIIGGLDVADEDEEVDVDYLQELAAQRRYFGLDKQLSQLPASASFEGREALAEQAAIALERAQTAYTRGLEFEHGGEVRKALECFRQIERYTTDYPGLQDDIGRMTQAIELLGDWTKPVMEERREDRDDEDESELELERESEPEQKRPPEPEKKRRVEPVRPSPPSQPRISEDRPESRSFFEDDTPRQKSRLVPLAILIIIALVAGAAGLSYYFSASKYDQANQRFSECRNSLQNNQFTDAEQQCESAIGLAKQIKLFKASERDLLITDIKRTLKSESLTQGLAGNLPLDGQYYPRQVVQDIENFRKFQKQGDDLLAASNWQQALSNYEQALAIAEKEEAIDRQQVIEISENMRMARFRISYESALAYIARKKWVLATSDFNLALEQLKTLSVTDKAAIIDDISSRLGEIAQATEKEKGDSAFLDSKWEEAAEHYRKALAVAMQGPNPDENSVFELKQLVVKGELYAIISAGKSAFRQAEWDKAIASYDQAITLLEDNRELLKQTNTDENKKKLARILLQASVIRDQQSAARFLKEGQYDKALEKLRAIINSVSSSDFNNEQLFIAAVEEARLSIEQTESDRQLSDKTRYLEDNFEDLFTRHYSGSPPESLTERTVVFEKQDGELLLFRLQCVDVAHGRPLQLVMKYAYDQKTGSWRFYSDAN